MTKKMKTETAVTANVDMSAVLSALPQAVKADRERMTATAKARIACLFWVDSLVAAYGDTDVLKATSRTNAPAARKEAYITLKEAMLSVAWGANFLAKVNNSDIPVTRNIGAPMGGMKGQTKAYWQAQKGAVWDGFVKRALAFVADRERETVAAAAIAAAKANGATLPAGATKAPNRKAPLADRCEQNIGTAIKAIVAATSAGKANAEEVPPTMHAGAVLFFAQLAIDALGKNERKRDMAIAAFDVMRAK